MRNITIINQEIDKLLSINAKCDFSQVIFDNIYSKLINTDKLSNADKNILFLAIHMLFLRKKEKSLYSKADLIELIRHLSYAFCVKRNRIIQLLYSRNKNVNKAKSNQDYNNYCDYDYDYDYFRCLIVR